MSVQGEGQRSGKSLMGILMTFGVNINLIDATCRTHVVLGGQRASRF